MCCTSKKDMYEQKGLGKLCKKKQSSMERFLQLLLTRTAGFPGTDRAPGPPLATKHLTRGSADAVLHPTALSGIQHPTACPGKNHNHEQIQVFRPFPGTSPVLEPLVSAQFPQPGTRFFSPAFKYCKYKNALTLSTQHFAPSIYSFFISSLHLAHLGCI